MTLRSSNSKALKTSVVLAGLLGLFIANQNCNMNSGKTKSDNPVFNLEFTDLNSYPEIQRLSLCIESIRLLNQAELGLVDGNYVTPLLDIDELTLNQSGTDLQHIDVPIGTYEQLEIDLDNHCSSQNSLEITNAIGAFTTNVDVTLVFKGTVSIDKNLSRLRLELDYIADKLKDVSSDAEIRLAAEVRFGRLYK